MKQDIFSEVVEGFKCLATEQQRNIRVRGVPETPQPSKTTTGKSSGRRIGAMKDKLTLPDSFYAPLTEEIQDAFEGTHE
ncbi:hypothetical protein [Pseudomonas brassicacearum]|uniref:hypothetical protein n=1 Tax=Pseudomonas brassicacearum TaxID=930166 RepID=UPI0016190F83|nr:hypothetical protein [Pseudomonas brassicacearum]